jgi:hypothetical protein
MVWFVSSGSILPLLVMTAISLALGWHLVASIGGADMPVVISMLNSYSGWAAAGIGFTLGNIALIVTGALVGSSGAILSYIMCKGMNRSFISVILGGFGGEVAAAAGGAEQRPVKLGSAEDAAYIMKNASKVIIVPGYGMAVAQAQHALREAKVLARNISSSLQGRDPQPFVYQTLGMMGSLGHGQAFGQLLKVRLRGLPAWFLRRTYYLLQMPGWGRRLRIMIDWTFALLFRPDIVKIGLDSETALLLHEVVARDIGPP